MTCVYAMRGYVGLFGVAGRNPSHWGRWFSWPAGRGACVLLSAGVPAWIVQVTHVLEASAFSSRNARAARRRLSQPAAEKALPCQGSSWTFPHTARHPCATSMILSQIAQFAATFLRSYALFVLHHQGYSLYEIIGPHKWPQRKRFAQC